MLMRMSALLLAVATVVGCAPRESDELASNGAATGSSATGTSAAGTSTTGTPTTGTMTTGTATTNAMGTGANAANNAAKSNEAVAKLVAIGNSGVAGEIKFTKSGDKVMVTGKVTGLTPGEHGFHVHEKGDLSDTEKGESAGGHFNPDMKSHGRPSDATRHAGDFGNITANDQGVAEINFEDPVVKIDGEHTIVGRSIVIHAQPDKFTQPSGDAGGRVAFGKIEMK